MSSYEMRQNVCVCKYVIRESKKPVEHDFRIFPFLTSPCLWNQAAHLITHTRLCPAAEPIAQMQAVFIYCSICDVLSFFDSAQTVHSNQGHN